LHSFSILDRFRILTTI